MENTKIDWALVKEELIKILKKRKRASEQAFRVGGPASARARGATICRIDKTKMQHSPRTANREKIIVDI
jgi:hypothetical protein